MTRKNINHEKLFNVIIDELQEGGKLWEPNTWTWEMESIRSGIENCMTVDEEESPERFERCLFGLFISLPNVVKRAFEARGLKMLTPLERKRLAEG